MFDFYSINYLAVIVAALVAYFLGALWYSSIMFGATWMKALGKTRDELPAPTFPMLIGFILTFVTSLGMALMIKALGVNTLRGGILVGLVVGIAFIMTNTLSEYLYSGASFKLFWIHAGYRMASIFVMGAILGGWQ